MSPLLVRVLASAEEQASAPCASQPWARIRMARPRNVVEPPAREWSVRITAAQVVVWKLGLVEGEAILGCEQAERFPAATQNAALHRRPIEPARPRRII
eukprot:CAMPEP_0181187354 /NCGR_PEP_ID=MMETSP1096-20121128/10525_1 /TAXON_ID=156174 ORGANISM="Chrysochromulina ericina, Strain CCMP281" /NCGR_SAMPLE_ID=MMETSP1096 /ASSEMBLY_ACC=CAM_ASM_000453 /LENGTH=98 /DNA_ID=CAMNT_0023276317 /DNA_START=1220 /DNA_END=1517 /DNA_ORIENTATION=+